MDIRYQTKTGKGFEQAIEDLKENLKSVGFGVLWELNFADKLREKGMAFDANFKIMEVCHPHKAKEVLEANIEVGYFLPCKMVVYEKDSEVYMGMLRPVEIVKMVDPKLVEMAQNIEYILVEAIENAC